MSGSDAFAVRLALQLFGFCARMLPRGLSAGYGAEITADFSGLARNAYGRGGALAVLLVLARSVLDLFIRAPQEQWLETHPDAFEDLRGPRAHLGDYMQFVLQELKLAARSIRKRPAFTLVAVLTLALGIGANVAIFAVVNAVLIRPLPYPQSERIVWVTHHAPGLNLPKLESSYGTLELYRKFSRSFESHAALQVTAQNLTGGEEPARVSVMQATPSIFDVLRIQPMLGRAFSEEEALPAAASVALLTHRGWQRHFAGARDVIGRTVKLNGTMVEIIGVMPREFAHPDPEMELIVPMRVDPAGGFGTFGIGNIMRLRAGVTLEAAAAEVVKLQPRLAELYPDMGADFLKQAGWSASLQTMRDRLVGDAELGLWIVLGTVGFLLLVACASVANLFLVRAESRQREVSVRFALGATRGRVAMTFLSESMLLCVAGGAWGLLLAYLAVGALIDAGPEQLPRLQEVALDLRAVGFATAISLFAGLIFGILPLPQHMRRPLSGIVRDGRGQTGGIDRQRVRKALIVAQIALALIMVTGSGLMLRSFQRLRSVEPGVRPEGVITMAISTGPELSKSSAAALYQRVVAEIDALPGTSKVGATNALPLAPDGLNGSSFSITGVTREEDALPPFAFYSVITENYFEAIGTRLLQGRALERADHEQKRNVIVVSNDFAKTYLQGNALGKTIYFSDSTRLEIVGVVEDVRTFGLREEIRPMIYMPMTTPVTTADARSMNIVVRSAVDPLSLVTPMRTAIRRIDGNVPILSARTMDQVVKQSMAGTSFTMTILLIAAVVAMLLGAVGLYGVIGYVVSQRTQEIGVRIALGALPAQVQRLVLRQGLVLAGLGVALGLAGAFAVSRVLEKVLFEVESRDPLTFAIVSLIMLGVSCVAAYLPARRASLVSPLQALRSE